jgi:cell division protease FtsH
LSGTPFGQERPYAEGTQEVIDQEVSRLLGDAEERAKNLLSENRETLDAVVAVLLEKETISGDELIAIVKRTHAPADGTSAEMASPRASN